MKLFDNLTGQLNKTKMVVKKNSPTILKVVGVTASIAAFGYAIYKTTKVDEVLDPAIENIKIAKEKDDKKEMCKVYAQTSWALAKHYYGPVVLEGIAIISFMKAIDTEHNRYLGASEALSLTTASLKELQSQFKEHKAYFKAYRENVVEEFGVAKEQKVTERTNEQFPRFRKRDDVEDKDKNSVNNGGYDSERVMEKRNSPYSKLFDEFSDYWRDNAEENLYFLNARCSEMNEKLERDGYLFLNDVYKALGLQPTRAGQVVGWVYNPEDPNYERVSFGLEDYLEDKALRKFLDGYEPIVLLDFNVDGDILALMR